MEQNFEQEFVNAESSMLAFAREEEQLQEESEMLAAEKKHSEITLKAIDETPDALLYKNAGKIYLLMDRQEIIACMTSRIESTDKELKFMQSTLQYVDKKVKESEEKVRDMIEIAQQGEQ